MPGWLILKEPADTQSYGTTGATLEEIRRPGFGKIFPDTREDIFLAALDSPPAAAEV